MKLRRYKFSKAAAVGIVGVALAHGAQAETVLDFDIRPADQGQNANLIQSFGDNAAASSDGVTVNGFGTPNIGLTWQGVGGQWQYYMDGVWSAGQLDSSGVGDRHEVVFAPNHPSVSVVVKSFNFHPYYAFAQFNEKFTYDWEVRSGATVLTNGSLAFQSDATKDHAVSINYTGALGATLTLRLSRVASVLTPPEVEGDPGDIAVDDIIFAQSPEMEFPDVSGPLVLSVIPANGDTNVPPDYFYRATITNRVSAIVTNTIQLKFNGSPVSPTPTVTQADALTTVSYQAPGLLPPRSTNRYTLTFNDDAMPANSYTNESQFVVVDYVDKQLPAPIVFENFDSTPEGTLPAGWTLASFADRDPTSEPGINFTNLDSDVYTNWTVVEASRFTGTFDTYSQLFKGQLQPPGEATDYQRVLSINPLNVVNGAFVRNLASGRFAFADSGYRLGVLRQIMYLFSPDFDLAGKTNVTLVFHSLWEQNQDSMAAVEYSIDMGATWLPVVYMLQGFPDGDPSDVLTNMDGTIDAVATFTNSYVDVAVFEDDADGFGEYGAFVGVDPFDWPTLGPYISRRVNDDPVESKRVECYRLPQADNQSKVRLRFVHAGTDSWYFGIDNVGLYSIPPLRITSIVRSGSNVIISWPGATGIRLEKTTSLSSPDWQEVPASNGASMATVPVTGSEAYFRLARPY